MMTNRSQGVPIVLEEGEVQKYWDPAWGEGAAPDGVSRMSLGHEEEE